VELIGTRSSEPRRRLADQIFAERSRLRRFRWHSFSQQFPSSRGKSTTYKRPRPTTRREIVQHHRGSPRLAPREKVRRCDPPLRRRRRSHRRARSSRLILRARPRAIALRCDGEHSARDLGRSSASGERALFFRERWYAGRSAPRPDGATQARSTTAMRQRRRPGAHVHAPRVPRPAHRRPRLHRRVARSPGDERGGARTRRASAKLDTDLAQPNSSSQILRIASVPTAAAGLSPTSLTRAGRTRSGNLTGPVSASWPARLTLR